MHEERSPRASGNLSRPRYAIKRRGEERRERTSLGFVMSLRGGGEERTCLGHGMPLRRDRKRRRDLSRPRTTLRRGGEGGGDLSRLR